MVTIFQAIGIDISWTIVGSPNHIYFSSCYYSDSNRYRDNMFFGDLISYIPGDVGATGLAGSSDPASSATSGHTSYSSYIGCFSPRNSRRAHTLSQQRWKILNYTSVSSAGNLIGYRTCYCRTRYL